MSGDYYSPGPKPKSSHPYSRLLTPKSRTQPGLIIDKSNEEDLLIFDPARDYVTELAQVLALLE